LATIVSLRSLHLDDTEVTDAGLKELYNLRNLEELSLKGTHVTKAGLSELRKALPECNVSR
jgi:internalin A